MSISPLMSSSDQSSSSHAAVFYRRVLEALRASSVPFLVGGSHAFTCHTSIERLTKDLDLFIRRKDYDDVGEVMREAGYSTEMVFAHWLAKVHDDEVFIDLIFNSGNGVCEVDDAWFAHATEGQVLGVPVLISPVEETIWSKAFIMERERYDGADVAHLLQAHANQLDWQRLLDRFGPHWRVLLSHLSLFGFVYPDHRSLVPGWVMEHLLERLRGEAHMAPEPTHLCNGTLLSREQYLDDTEQQGFQDGRLAPFGNLTPRDVTEWTRAIPRLQVPDQTDPP
ncbi:nucleotidyltransferase [Aquabacterium sp. CECT 9606]|uniref:nucleotidyltransferase n=1 Tax=Aquabacterium sp. CECT 9606 TaxID=2845822 RepID=UPI001E54F10C|nr:nucleotidyltransferase [Aquabacterium sp. CECT 9606]